MYVSAYDVYVLEFKCMNVYVCVCAYERLCVYVFVGARACLCVYASVCIKYLSRALTAGPPSPHLSICPGVHSWPVPATTWWV